MELTTKTPCDVRTFATLNPDGSVVVKVTGHAPYADLMVTSAEIATADLPKDKVDAVAALLAEIAESQTQKLGVLVQHAMHESRRAGRVQGELDANFAPVKALKIADTNTEAAHA